MKIHLRADPQFQDVEVEIRCPQVNEDILRIAAMLRVMDRKLTGTIHGEIRILDPKTVLYADTVDKKTFLYTKDAVLESALRLYELEDQLKDADFFRIGKSCLVNFARISAIRPEMGGRMLLTMENNEQLWVSRQYAGAIREKLRSLERRAKT